MITDLSRLAAAINSARERDEELVAALRSQKERIILELGRQGRALLETGRKTYLIYVEGRQASENDRPRGEICRRCEGRSPGFGPCQSGLAGEASANGFGEVPCEICPRGSGSQPPGRWYKPWRWLI